MSSTLPEMRPVHDVSDRLVHPWWSGYALVYRLINLKGNIIFCETKMNFAPPTDVVNNRRIPFMSRRAHHQARQMRSIEKCCAARMQKDTTTLTTRLRGLFVNGSSAHDSTATSVWSNCSRARPHLLTPSCCFQQIRSQGNISTLLLRFGADLERVIATSVHRSFMKKRDFCWRSTTWQDHFRSFN